MLVDGIGDHDSSSIVSLSSTSVSEVRMDQPFQTPTEASGEPIEGLPVTLADSLDQLFCGHWVVHVNRHLMES